MWWIPKFIFCLPLDKANKPHIDLSWGMMDYLERDNINPNPNYNNNSMSNNSYGNIYSSNSKDNAYNHNPSISDRSAQKTKQLPGVY